MPTQSPSTRKQCDFTKLIVAGYEVELNNGSSQDFNVTFHGPTGSRETCEWTPQSSTIASDDTDDCAPYDSGVWKVHVTLPDDYPFVSPSIGFVNKILHPNIDEASGSVCLDVINQTWRPIYSLVNIFDVFLPQLLTYPNASDPLNTEAANLLLRNKELYERKIRDYVAQHASMDLYLRRENTAGGHHSAFLDMPKATEDNRRGATSHCSTTSNDDTTSGSSTFKNGDKEGSKIDEAMCSEPQPVLATRNTRAQHQPETPLSSISVSEVREDDDLLDDEDEIFLY